MEFTLIIASLVAAFIAGIAALFAPCCITVLLPTYLGSIFRQRRTVVAMTLVFFLGLLAVFLPLGLGFASIGTLFSRNHDWLFIIGGCFLLLLGASILLGFHLSLPFTKHPKTKIKGAGSVFILGVFSAFATLCCAPVLAGVMALSILPGSIFWGAMYSLAYVAGMIAPLLLIAGFLDRFDFTKKFEKLSQGVAYRIAGKVISITIAEMISGAMFLLLGAFIIYLALAGKIAMENNDFQTSVNIFMSNLTDSINNVMGRMPLLFWPALALFSAVIIYKYVKHHKQNSNALKKSRRMR
ncbi:cytochrome c biogenesis protein CcdA [Candidatus Woesearchaeota archaeon]|nr:cytochrome c biogenesis protein CcdA [Candidatus Woesearchaeota archaeon]